MPNVDERTEHGNNPLPHRDNVMSEDVGRISETLKAHDKAIHESTTDKAGMAASTHAVVTTLTKDVLNLKDSFGKTAKASDFGIVSAFQNMVDAQKNQELMQSGILSARQYNYHGVEGSLNRTVWDRNYGAASAHNHPNYDRMSGNAEVTCITPTGDYIRLRHSDYRHKQTIQGAFGATEDVPFTTVPGNIASINDLNSQMEAMRGLYAQYEAGHMPQGFKFVMVVIETWVEYFTGDSSETFDSFRHQNAVNKAVEQYRLNKVYADTGLKDRFENLPINKVFVAGLNNDGTPILAVLKGRFICQDISEFGDIRPHLDYVDDLTMSELRGLKEDRFRVHESYNSPSALDRMMNLVPGLNGAGSYLEEIHHRNNVTSSIAKWGTTEPQNAAYYTRWGATLDNDASNRRNYKKGFNIPNFFSALTTHENIINAEYGGHNYRISWAMPYEIILYHPIMGWNPLNLPTLSTRPLDGDTGGKTPETAFAGIHPNSAWFMTPHNFFTANPQFDRAGTGSGIRYVKDTNNVPHGVRATGTYIHLPEIEGVGKIRQRYPIYSKPQDGSYETALVHSYRKRNLGITDLLSAALTELQTAQIKNLGEL